jgi:hypothetical protein
LNSCHDFLSVVTVFGGQTCSPKPGTYIEFIYG